MQIFGGIEDGTFFQSIKQREIQERSRVRLNTAYKDLTFFIDKLGNPSGLLSITLSTENKVLFTFVFSKLFKSSLYCSSYYAQFGDKMNQLQSAVHAVFQLGGCGI